MLSLIDYKSVNLSALDKLQSQQKFKVNYNNIIGGGAVLNGDNLVAFGVIKQFAELVLVANQNCSRLTRSKAMMQLMNHAIFLAHINKVEQVHATIADEKLADAIIKHYKFEIIPEHVLVKNVG